MNFTCHSGASNDLAAKANHPVRVRSWLALLRVGLPLVYVLSIGPTALGLSKPHPPGTAMQVITIFYKPLDWLHDKTFMKAPLENHVKFWIEL